MSLADLLDPSVGGDDLLVHAGGVDHTRAAVESLADRIARSLRERGVGPAEPVAVLLPNGMEVVAALLGVWRAGAVYLPLNPRGSAAERRAVIERLGPSAMVALDEGGVTVVAGERRGKPLAEGVALVQFTSGTTGEPKPVQLTHDGVLELLDGVIAKLRGGGARAGSPMPNLVPVSLSLWAGIYQVLFALRVGAPVVLMDAFEPREFRDLVARFEIRSTVLPPAAMTALADDEGVTDLAPLRYVRSITAPLSPLQARRFRDRFGIAVLNSYGQTEIGGEIVGWSAADSREHGESKLGSVGRPHRGVEVRAVDEEGAPLGAGEEGELWVRTPTLAAGYADGSDLGDRLSPDGWFRTGDIGSVDEEGFVWITGRLSDMINRGGLKVHPGEVEEVLRLDPSVDDVAVVGAPDDRVGEVPWAFVVLHQGAVLDEPALDRRCREHLAPYKAPAAYRAIGQLPRNEVGKVLRRELLAQQPSQEVT